MSEALARAMFDVESTHHIHGDQCLCGFRSSVSRDRTKHIMNATLEAAASFIAAQAWDQGRESEYEYSTKRQLRAAYGEEMPEPPGNPYKTEERKTTIMRMDDPTPEWKELK